MISQAILEANSVIVLLDKNNRPARIPAAVKSKVKQFISNESSAMDLIKSFGPLNVMARLNPHYYNNT